MAETPGSWATAARVVWAVMVRPVALVRMAWCSTDSMGVPVDRAAREVRAAQHRRASVAQVVGVARAAMAVKEATVISGRPA